jgi:hypothetical protein
MTVDEELSVLESNLRRLKIEYEIFFSGAQKRPPTDLEWKVLALLRKFGDGGRLNFAQRFRYNEMAQRYAIYSDLWRKKGRIREEGYRRPQDALLSVQGVRPEEHEHGHKVYGVSHAEPFIMAGEDASSDQEKVQKLFSALADAKQKAGEKVSGSLESFNSFVQKKTKEIKKQYGCDKVEYSIDIADGKVKLTARAKA